MRFESTRLLLITACLLCGCRDAAKNEPAETVGASAKTTESKEQRHSAEPVEQDREPNEVRPVETIGDVTQTTEAKEEPPVEAQAEPDEVSMEERLAKAVDKSQTESRSGRLYRLDTGEIYTGWIKEFFAGTDQIKLLSWIKNGKDDGPGIVWHANGQKEFEGTFNEGELDGLCTIWHENGQKYEEAIFKDSKEEGTVRQWHANGQKKMEATFKEGELAGEPTLWDENGELVSEWTDTTVRESVHNNEGHAMRSESTRFLMAMTLLMFTACLCCGCGETSGDEPAKTIEASNESPAVDSRRANEKSFQEQLAKAVDKSKTELRDGRLFLANSDAAFTGWVKSVEGIEQVTSLRQFSRGKQRGPTTLWYEEGKTKRKAFRLDDLTFGTAIEWYSANKKQKKTETTFLLWKIWPATNQGTGKADRTAWYENGKKKSESIWQRDEDGFLTELQATTTWHENGKKNNEGTRRNGDLEGRYTEWYENGQKMYEANFKDGEVVGPELEWEEDGTLLE